MARQSRTDIKHEPVTRERVLDEAAALFAERGYGAATTRELADRLDIQRASLYYHVVSKEQILADICELVMTQGLADVRLALEQASKDDPLGRLRCLIEAHLSTSLRHRNRHLTMLLEIRAVPSDERDRLMMLRSEYETEIDDIVLEAQKRGGLRSDLSAAEIRLALLNMLNWTLIWYTPNGEYTPEKLAQLITTIFIDGTKAQ